MSHYYVPAGRRGFGFTTDWATAVKSANHYARLDRRRYAVQWNRSMQVWVVIPK